MHRACFGHQQWRSVISQEFYRGLVPVSDSTDHSAVARVNAVVDPDNQKEARFTVLERTLAALFRDGHLQASWGMLKDMYPELEVSGKLPCEQT